MCEKKKISSAGKFLNLVLHFGRCGYYQRYKKADFVCRKQEAYLNIECPDWRACPQKPVQPDRQVCTHTPHPTFADTPRHTTLYSPPPRPARGRTGEDRAGDAGGDARGGEAEEEADVEEQLGDDQVRP